ncbi:Protein FAM3A [Sciurus carolinensis]|uniref:Protein FAM3A n=1 Tax=Sciurus carolinensis TaxID=30640 RepID=A0AA41T149_SCICA|nr:Protein FAM3A [Sciurus carolinensis]
MRLAGPLHIVALVVTLGLTWMVVNILLGGSGSGFPCIQQFFNNSESSVTAEPRARKYKCGLPQPCPEEHLAFCMVSGAANVIEPKICLEDRMLMSSVKDNVGPGLHVALVNGVSCELIEARDSDMWTGDVNDLLKIIWPLHEGTLVCVASCNDPVTKMNEETRKLFSELGSRNAKELAFHDNWVFVGAQGVQNSSPFKQSPSPGWVEVCVSPTGHSLTRPTSPHIQSALASNSAPAGSPNPAGEVDMRLAGPLHIVALVVTLGLTWMVVNILLGGSGSGFPCIQQFFNNSESSVTAEPRARKYKCGLPQPCPEEHLAFCMVSGAANVIEPKICLEDRMLMSSVKDNVGPGLHVALVNGVSCELIEARDSDMWTGDVNDLLKIIWPLHEGTLVCVASCNDPVTKMNEETRKLFSELGSRNAKELAFHDNWVFVGAQGVQNSSPFKQCECFSEPNLVPTSTCLTASSLTLSRRGSSWGRLA